MNLVAGDERNEDELSVQALGISVILIGEGWEEADYVEPGDAPAGRDGRRTIGRPTPGV